MIGGPNKITLKLKLMPNQSIIPLYCMIIFLSIRITLFTLRLLSSLLRLINKKVEVSKIVALQTMIFVSFKNLNLHNWFLVWLTCMLKLLLNNLLIGWSYHENMDSENDQYTPPRSSYQLSHCLLLCINESSYLELQRCRWVSFSWLHLWIVI